MEFEWRKSPDRVVSSVRLNISPHETRLRIWLRGELAGELVIREDEWPSLVAMLGFNPGEGKRIE